MSQAALSWCAPCLIEPDISERIRGIKAPTLVIAGKDASFMFSLFTT
jgi:hypothetical protein